MAVYVFSCADISFFLKKNRWFLYRENNNFSSVVVIVIVVVARARAFGFLPFFFSSACASSLKFAVVSLRAVNQNAPRAEEAKDRLNILFNTV